MYTGGSNCDNYTIWASSNTETFGSTSASSMCMSVPLFGAASYTGTNRYTGGCLSSSDLTTANTYIANLYTFYTSANTLYTNQRSVLSTTGASGAKYEGDALLTAFNANSFTPYSALNTSFSTFIAYINAFENTSVGLKSCAFFRTDMLIFSNTICFKTVQSFVDQTMWLCMMGPFLCLMSICMFAAIRCPLQKAKDVNKTAPHGSPQMQNIDKQGNPYYVPGNQQNTGYNQVDNTKHGLDI